MKHAYKKYMIYKNPGVKDKCAYIVQCIINAIEQEVLLPGKIVLSQRELANRLHIGRGILERAYSILIDIGYFDSVSKSHTMVSENLPNLKFKNRVPFKKKLSRPIHRSLNCEFEKNGHLNYVKLGTKDLNPATVMFVKPNKIMEILKVNANTKAADWKSARDITERFIKVAQRSRAKTRNLKIGKEQIGIGYYRPTVLYNLIQVLLDKNEGIALSSHADFVLINYLSEHGMRLFFLECDGQGLPLDKLKKLIEKQRNTDKPITAVFSNPIRDAFGSSKDSHERRTQLVKLTEELGILLLEEYADDEFVEPSNLPLVERLGSPMGMMVTFGPISSFTAEMRRIMVVMGPDNVIREFKRREGQIPYEEGLTLKALEQLHAKGIYSLMTADSVRQINSWRHEIMGYAKSYLDPWFEMKDSNCGTALWLFAKEKKAIEIPVLDLIANQFPDINSNMEMKDTMPVGALKIGFGSGQTKLYKDAFIFLSNWWKGVATMG